jgi:hypothetical protein
MLVSLHLLLLYSYLTLFLFAFSFHQAASKDKSRLFRVFLFRKPLCFEFFPLLISIFIPHFPALHGFQSLLSCPVMLFVLIVILTIGDRSGEPEEEDESAPPNAQVQPQNENVLSVAPTGTGINMVELNRRSADYLTS